MNQQEKNRSHNRALCVAAVVWLLLAAILPGSELWAAILTLFATGLTYFVVKSRAIK